MFLHRYVRDRYRIYSINRPGRLLNFWTLRVGAYSRWALIRGWALIKFSPFSASEECVFYRNLALLLAFIVLLQNKHTSLAETGENLISAQPPISAHS